MPACVNVCKRTRLRARTCVRSRLRIAVQSSACVGVRTSAFALPRVCMGLCPLNCARARVCELGCVCVRAHACACAMCMCARAGVGLSARGCSVDVCCVWWWVVWCVCLHVRGVFFGRADRVLCVVALGPCVWIVLLECCMSV